MVRQQRRNFNRREKRALARIMLTSFFLSLLLLSIAPGCSLRAYVAVKKQAEQLRAENQLLLRKTVQLNEEIRLLQHDDRYLEQIARKQYGMLKKNEEVYYYQQSEQKEPPAAAPETAGP